jgi:Cys-tRNA(Pro)/Cys-tRNA(Cys) deacylase
MSSAPTPAAAALEGLPHRLLHYEHDGGPVTGVEAAEGLGLDPDRVFKTLLTTAGVAVVPVALRLSLKAAAKALGAKRAEMLDPAEAERRSRSVVGAISPFGLPRATPTALDESALLFPVIYVSGGRRGLEIEIDPHLLIDRLDAVVAHLTTG